MVSHKLRSVTKYTFIQNVQYLFISNRQHNKRNILLKFDYEKKIYISFL